MEGWNVPLTVYMSCSLEQGILDLEDLSSVYLCYWFLAVVTYPDEGPVAGAGTFGSGDVLSRICSCRVIIC